MMSAGRNLPSAVTMPSRAKWSMLVGDQFDVRFGQCPEPVVVEQNALAIGRIGRHAFFDQVGAVLQFRQDELRQLLAVPVVALVDGAIGMRPGRILAQERQQPVAIAPEHVEAIPLHVKRQMREQPLRALGDRIGIALHRPRPLRGALIDGDRGHAVGDRRHELHRGGAGADHGDMLAVELDVVGPQRRMQHRSRKILVALEMGGGGVIELADRTDQRRWIQTSLRRCSVLSVEIQRRLLSSQCDDGQFGVEPDMLADVVFPTHLQQIVEQFLRVARNSGSMDFARRTRRNRSGSAYRRRSRGSG